MNDRPIIFIGSSVEGKKIANSIARCLDKFVKVNIWCSDDVFELSKSTISSLIRSAYKCDISLFIMTPDDRTKIRKEYFLIARDNVVFELGLFAGIQGSDCVYFTYPNDANFHMPSDLLGITALPISVRYKKKYFYISQKSLLAAKTKLKKSINRLMGIKPNNMSLCGKWKVKWSVKNSVSHDRNTYTSNTEILQLGDKIKTKISTKKKTYAIRGNISGNYISGTWGDSENGQYFGTFQLYKHPMCTELKGKWIGFKQNNVIDTGELEFNRIGKRKKTV